MINEVDEILIDKYFDIIEKNCKKILSFYKVARNVFYRGSQADKISKDKILVKKKARLSNREPVNTQIAAHEYANEIFEDVFGWKVRNGVFATSSEKEAKIYGKKFIFFPIGDFKFVWSPQIQDAFGDTIWFISKYHPDDGKERIEKDIKGLYIDKDLKRAMDLESEVSFKCKEYYLLNDYNYKVRDKMIERWKI